MLVALFDRDFQSMVRRRTYFSLDLMKLSSYYKSKQNIVVPITSLDDKDLYTKIVIYSDFCNPSDIILDNYDNIDFRGMSFTIDFIPLPPEIENMPNDFTIYQKLIEKTDYPNKVLERLRALMRASHIRIAPDGKNLSSRFTKDLDYSKRNLVIHDKNFFDIDGCKDVIQDLTSQKDFLFHFKYEQDIKNFEDFKFIYSKKMLDTGSFHFGQMTNEDFKWLCSKPFSLREMKVECISKDTDDYLLLMFEIQNLIKRIIFSIAHNKKITLINTRNLFDKNLEDFIDLLISWNLSDYKMGFYEFYTKDKKKRTLLREKKISTVVNQYQLYDLLSIPAEKFKEIEL